jgi:hypothetical protein
MIWLRITKVGALPCLLLWAFTASAADLEIQLTDAKWDGETVPADQVCQRFNGHGATPPMRISGLPTGTQSLQVAFNDESYQPMDKGGHGILQFTLAPGSTTVDLPVVQGETDDLPAGVTKVSGHRAPGWSGTGGAYLPPCSGGQGNTYTATASAMAGDEVLASGKVSLGKF